MCQFEANFVLLCSLYSILLSSPFHFYLRRIHLRNAYFEAIWLRNAVWGQKINVLHHFNLPLKWSLKCRFCGCLINSELCFPWKLFFSTWMIVFVHMSCCSSLVRDVHSFFNFFLKIFAFVMSFIRFLLSIVVHFFISSFMITFFLRYSCFFYIVFFPEWFIIFTSHISGVRSPQHSISKS